MSVTSRNPAALARPWPNPYVYASPAKRVLAHGIDALGRFLFSRGQAAIPWRQLRRVAVLRLDHLGDVLNSFGLLENLRRGLPSASIDLWTGSWGEGMARLSPHVDKVRVFDAPWFERPKRKAWPLADIRRLGERLKAENYDLVIEPRGEFRHHLAIRLSGAPWRLALSQSVGGFLATHVTPFRPGLHEQQQNLEVLRRFDFPGSIRESPVRLVPGRDAIERATGIMKKLRLGPGFVAVQAACGTSAKRWMPENWARLIDGLGSSRVVLLGSDAEKGEMLQLAKACRRKPAVASGMLDIEGLAAFLKKARLLISVDSMPAHLAAAVGLPVVALYSGTNRVEQWAPRGKKVKLLQAVPSCSPCELTRCPFDNECMRRLEVEAVRGELRAWL